MAFKHRHLLGIEPLAPEAIREILDLSDSYVDLNRRPNKHSDVLAGRTQVNMFFENSTRTQASLIFETSLPDSDSSELWLSVEFGLVEVGNIMCRYGPAEFETQCYQLGPRLDLFETQCRASDFTCVCSWCDNPVTICSTLYGCFLCMFKCQ